MADQRHNQDRFKLPADRKPLIISVVLHLIVFGLVIFGMPQWRKDIEIEQPVAVELVDNIADVATTNKPPAKTAKPVDKPTPEPPKKQEKKNTPPAPETKPETKPEPPKPEPPKPESKPEPKPEPKPQDVEEPPPPPDESELEPPPEKPPEKIAEKKPTPPQPKPEPKAEPKKPKPKPEPKKQQDPKKTQESFDSLLKDLTPNEEPTEEQPEESETDGHPDPAPNISNFSTVMSMTDMDALRAQLAQCWSIPAGARDSQDLNVDVRVTVNQARVVTSAEIVDQGRYHSDTFFRAAADSVLRAINSPDCTPLNLPPEKYDQWHEMTINFNPREMF